MTDHRIVAPVGLSLSMPERKRIRWLSFSLRSLLLVMTIVAVVLGVWARARYFRGLAAEHHWQTMDFGYQAAAIQRPIDPQWEWKNPAELKMDRATIARAAPFWQTSMYHAQLRDIYLSAAQRPWLPCQPIPPDPSPIVVPPGEEPAAQWWHDSFGVYVERNPCLMEAFMGFPSGDRNLVYAQTLLTTEQFSSLQARFRERRGIAVGR